MMPLLDRSRKCTLSVKIKTSVFDALSCKRRLLGWSQRQIVEYILSRALMPPDKLYKVISAEMVQDFDFLRQLKEKADAEVRISENKAQKELIFH